MWSRKEACPMLLKYFNFIFDILFYKKYEIRYLFFYYNLI